MDKEEFKAKFLNACRAVNDVEMDIGDGTKSHEERKDLIAETFYHEAYPRVIGKFG